MRIAPPVTPEEWDAYFHLRYEVLRKPWDQPESSSKVEDDLDAWHFALFDGNTILACCRLHEDKPHEAQLRFMAVHAACQGQGLGKAILSHAEHFAKKKGIHRIWMNARENAIPFYLSCGYSICGEGPLLWDIIPHKMMEKKLDESLSFTE